MAPASVYIGGTRVRETYTVPLFLTAILRCVLEGLSDVITRTELHDVRWLYLAYYQH
jgi:hypothetical protein